MDRRVFVWLFMLISSASVGCQNDPHIRAYIDTLNTEKRLLEDRVYALEYDLEIAREELERAQEKKVDDRKSPSRFDVDPPPRRTNGSTPSRNSKSKSPNLVPPEIDSGNSATPKVELELPEIDLGTPAAPTKSSPPASSPIPSGQRSSITPAPSETEPISVRDGSGNAAVPNVPPTEIDAPASEITEGSSNVAPGNDASITHIYVNPFLTTAADFDSKSGDDGVILVIEPRNANNEYVASSGNISVVLLDPAKEGDAARVARWDLRADEVARFVRDAANGAGIHLRMPWPGQPPENSRLKMFVRFETTDHRKLQGEQEIYVTLPGQLSQRWTPRTRRDGGGTANEATAPMQAQSPALVAPPSNTLPPVMPPQNTEPRSVLMPRPTWKPER